MKRTLLVVLYLIAVTKGAAAFSLSTTTTQKTTQQTTGNLNFEDWIRDAPQEVRQWKSLKIEGTIPSYVDGTLVRNGAALWSAQANDDQFSHIFDGLAKISAYRIVKGEQVMYRNEFIRSNWYHKTVNSNKLPPSISTGPILSAQTKEPKTGLWRMLQAVANTPEFDNTPVNVFDYDPESKGSRTHTVCALTDAPPRAFLSLDDMQTLSTMNAPKSPSGARGYELLLTAHPEYSKGSYRPLRTYNIAVELGLNGPRVSLVEEFPDGNRRVVGQSEPIHDGVPYLHSFGVSERYAIVTLQPLRVDLANLSKLMKVGFLRGMNEVEQTRVLVFDLETGDCLVNTVVDEKVFFYHSISTAESKNYKDETEVSVRLCAYRVPDIISGEDQFMRLERCQQGKEWRNRISKGGTFCDITCNLENRSVKVDWNNKIQQGFELPTTRYSRAFGKDTLSDRHPRYVYAFGAYACGSEEYDSWGLFKYDMEGNCVSSFHNKDSRYVSEPIFVADPNGSKEDDGVVLSQIYDGNRQETALLVLDARSMKELACVWTSNRSPMDFHGAWIPQK